MSVYHRIRNKNEWKPHPDWFRVRTIDMHTEGEPLRVLISGLPEIKGTTVLEKRNYFKSHYDHIRTSLMLEPRGHADMYGCILTPPERPDSHFGIIFMHNEGYSTMCGHATIAITRLAVEMDWLKVSEPVTELRIDAPCGQIRSFAEIESGKVRSCRFQNVPSFAVALDCKITVKDMGSIRYDLAYGGAYYAYVESSQLNLELNPGNYRGLIHYGKLLKRSIAEKDAGLIRHPFETDLGFLYGIIFIGEAHDPNNHSRNVCIFADGEVDRSPTGSGVSGRMAIHFARNEVRIGERISIESILGTTFTGSVVQETEFGGIRSIIPEVGGTAFITGQNEFLIDPDDPLSNGFLLR